MSLISRLAKLPLKTFRVNFANEHKNLIINHVATDASHPLHETQCRRQAEKKKQGLWWHVTTGVDLHKSSCVRAWCRRRLRRAVVEELKARGYDEHGKFANLKLVPQRADLMARLVAGQTLDLKGSLRLLVQAPLIPAKYVDVRAEVGAVVDAVKNGMRGAPPGEYASAGRPRSRPSFSPPATSAQTSPRRTHKHVVESGARSRPASQPGATRRIQLASMVSRIDR
ncbi:hypothetical protein G6011_07009 [Alternaria panax]|uniref:Uncharacterized protein n=1 Tax=Alternaria panax TaxID=48097 RepID=A0AAD4F978_9PLEO|nr:hypothetical protein G6011_07009 [Alternaria panax]